MSPRTEKVEMSHFIPRAWLRRVLRRNEERLPLFIVDTIRWFWVQTKLIFSRSILLMTGALFLGFCAGTIGIAINDEAVYPLDAFLFISIQIILLSVLIHMNIWESERDERTFELLIMRIPNLHRLIASKMTVSLIWILIINFPFWLGYTWFAEMAIADALWILLFTLMTGCFAALLCCIAVSFIHHGLASGIVTVIPLMMLLGMSNEMPPMIKAWMPFICPLEFTNPFGMSSHDRPTIPSEQALWKFAVNRFLFLLACSGLYWWLYRRLSKTEKWIA